MTPDSNGILYLEETDPITPFQTTINALQAATSGVIEPLLYNSDDIVLPKLAGLGGAEVVIHRVGHVVDLFTTGNVSATFPPGLPDVIATGGVPVGLRAALANRDGPARLSASCSWVLLLRAVDTIPASHQSGESRTPVPVAPTFVLSPP